MRHPTTTAARDQAHRLQRQRAWRTSCRVALSAPRRRPWATRRAAPRRKRGAGSRRRGHPGGRCPRSPTQPTTTTRRRPTARVGRTRQPGGRPAGRGAGCDACRSPASAGRTPATSRPGWASQASQTDIAGPGSRHAPAGRRRARRCMACRPRRRCRAARSRAPGGRCGGAGAQVVREGDAGQRPAVDAEPGHGDGNGATSASGSRRLNSGMTSPYLGAWARVAKYAALTVPRPGLVRFVTCRRTTTTSGSPTCSPTPRTVTMARFKALDLGSRPSRT